jgi:gamma-glutamyltranspeptidase
MEKVIHPLFAHDAVPGNMKLSDLANYQPVVRDVITTKFQEHDIIVAPAVGNDLE